MIKMASAPSSLMLMTVFIFLFTSIPASEHPNEQSSIYTNDTDSVLEDEVEGQQWLYSNFPTADASASVSERCVSDTRIQLAALRHQMPWALQMHKSSGQLTMKLAETGTGSAYHDSGLFDECLSVVIQPHLLFTAKYCTVFFDLQQPRSSLRPSPIDERPSSNNRSTDADDDSAKLPIIRNNKRHSSIEPVDNMSNFVKSSVAFCIPSTCTADDLLSAVAHHLKRLSSFTPISSEDYCYTTNKIREDSRFSIGAVVTCCFIGLLCVVIITATIHEAIISRSAAPTNDTLLHCFSLIRNGRDLLSNKAGGGGDELSCLYGIRFLAMCILIAFHVGSTALSGNTLNTSQGYQASVGWQYQFVTNGSVFVEPFFLMSGLLVSMSLLRQLDRSKGSFNIWRYYFHRYVRLTPLYAVVIALVAFVLPLIGTGPNWHYVRQMSDATRRLWWTQLLYINNYIPMSGGMETFGRNSPQSGLAETWYLACEMQMFWLSPLFVYPLWRWRKAGFAFIIASLLILLALSTIPFVVYDLIPTLVTSSGPVMENVKRIDDYWYYFYIQTYCRLPPYIIGILLGWFLHKNHTKDLLISQRRITRMKTFLVVFGWTISTLMALSIIFGLAPFMDALPSSSRGSLITSGFMNSFVRILYGAFHRSAFSLSMAWVIFACNRRYAGFINNFLSWKVFFPLGRLCYAAYLINLTLIKMYTAHQRTPLYLIESQFFVNLVGLIAIVFITSLLLSMAVEMPFLNVNRLYTTRSSPPPSSSQTNSCIR